MTRQLIIILTIATILFGCDFSKQIEDRIESGAKDTKTEMRSDISSAKSNFTELHKKVLKQTTDSIKSAKLVNLYSSITITAKYIDSLRTEINRLDNKDLRNIDLLKEIFLNNGIGDSIFNKVKHSYSLTIDIALADTTKSRLKQVQETYSEETKQLFFELNSPLGVNIILSGVESELIKDGIRSLQGYVKH